MDDKLKTTGLSKTSALKSIGLSRSSYCHIPLNETLPIAPLEAVIVGKSIVASNDAGLSEIIMNAFNGILINSNSNSVAEAILTLVKKPNFMQDLSRNAIITATTKFSWEKITEKYIKLYKNGL